MILASRDELIDFLDGKSVALVGPSPHLQGKSMGSKIDTHDVVARVNEADSSKIPDDYGSRTDLVFFNFGPNTKREFEKLKSHGESLDKPLWLVCPRPLGDMDEHYVELGTPQSDGDTSTKVVFLNGIDEIPLSDRKWPRFPTTGFLSMIFMMQAPIEQLFVAGFSFFSGVRSYNNEIVKSDKKSERPVFHVAAHPVIEEVRWLQSWELPIWVSYDDKFRKIVVEGKYFGRNPFVLGIQVIRNSINGMRVRLGSKT